MTALRRRPDIQGLRALAVGLVVLSHAGVPGFSGGYVGVDIFFVISGYLITSVLVREGGSGERISLVDFYRRRARRILPAATVTIVAVLAYAACSLPLSRLSAVVRDGLWSAVFAANIHFANVGANYFSDPAPSPLQHFWSLAVEEQFYLLWPLVVLLVGLAARGAARRRMLVGAVVVIAALSLVWSLHLSAVAGASAYFSAPARAYELCIGALLALVTDAGRSLAAWVSVRLRVALGWCSLAVIAWITATWGSQTPMPGWHALVPALATAGLLIAGIGDARGASVLLSRRPLCFLGDISYSLYLCHWPILKLGEVALHSVRADVRTVVLIWLSVTVAAVSYHLVEQPFQQRRIRLPRRATDLALWPAALALVGVTAWATTGYADLAASGQRSTDAAWFAHHRDTSAEPAPSSSLPVRPTAAVSTQLTRSLRLARAGAPIPPSLNLTLEQQDVFRNHYPCIAWWGESTTRICPQGDTRAGRTVVLLGDSHAGMWTTALDRLGHEHHFRLIPLIKPACNAYDVPQHSRLMPASACTGFKSWAVGQVRRLHPAVLVIAAKGYDSVRPPRGSSLQRTWSDGVTRSMRLLSTLAPRVDVLSDVPSRPSTAMDCLTARGATEASCVVPEQSRPTSSNPLTWSAVRGTRARWIDVDDLVCVDQRCPLVVGNLIVYYDDNHISDSWSRHVADALGQKLGPAVLG